ncbi:UNVERIFIED_CONTAM: hypothetical protein FKN15_057318 [Acipenser sinensis]
MAWGAENNSEYFHAIPNSSQNVPLMTAMHPEHSKQCFSWCRLEVSYTRL